MSTIYYFDDNIGAHTAFSGKICDTLWTAINFGMGAVQFFMGSPQSINRSKISSSDLTECHKILSRFPLQIFSHFPFTTNLAGSTKELAWANTQNCTSTQNAKILNVIKNLEYELEILSKLNGGVVIHPGNFPDRKLGLLTIANTINHIQFPESSKLILENSAGQGCSLATTFSEIKDIIDEVKNPSHIGVCIDTCHLFAFGDYNLSLVEEVERMFTDFDTIIGLDKFSLLHLNDSETKQGSKVDRHACLGTGFIWKDNFDSLVYLLKRCSTYKIPIVLETHGLDMLVCYALRNP